MKKKRTKQIGKKIEKNWKNSFGLSDPNIILLPKEIFLRSSSQHTRMVVTLDEKCRRAVLGPTKTLCFKWFEVGRAKVIEFIEEYGPQR